ncbi:hypothetical protein NPIL_593191 [Nephila pilipes]|uniref:Uncharacterized protein n=1 Tax=Nephila pilipes TaxID=299642 RepID=A0A8X6ITW8_NEPPI|nr:hypothetical protein NPIL_593191 [Nephila pilipes]
MNYKSRTVPFALVRQPQPRVLAKARVVKVRCYALKSGARWWRGVPQSGAAAARVACAVARFLPNCELEVHFLFSSANKYLHLSGKPASHMLEGAVESLDCPNSAPVKDSTVTPTL